MKRVVLWGVLSFAVMVGLVFWLEDDRVAMRETERAFAVDGSSVSVRPSKWNEPIVARGSRRLSGVVLRDGSPVSGAVITALEAHGDHVLSDLPCQCDNHCGQKLLACGCAEASGQLVELVGARTGEAAPLGRATSANDGTFVIEGLDDTSVTLWADASGGIAWKADVASDANDVKLALLPGRTIKGKVSTTDGSTPSGVLVTSIFSEQSRFFDTTTHADGTFEIGPVPLGKYAVVAMQNGLLPDHEQVSDDESEVELELSVPRRLSGVVVKNGSPVEHATVKLDGMHRKRTVTSDEKGAFVIERLRPGRYELSGRGAGAIGSVKTQVSKSEDRSDVVIELEDGVPFDGVVVDERGAPVSGVTVQVEAANEWLRADSNDEGNFHFDVVSAGEREVWATKTGYLRLERQKVIPGSTPTRLTLTRAALLSGSVRTADGALVADFGITARLADAGSEASELDFDFASRVRRRSSQLSKHSTDGGFALEVMPGVPYVLTVSPREFAETTVEGTAPRDDLVIVVKRGATIRGRVLDADGKPAARVFVLGSSTDDNKSQETDAEGRFTLGGLMPGRWTLQAHSFARTGSSWRASANVELAREATVEVDLRPSLGARIAGVVVDESGAPVPNVPILATAKGEDTEEDGLPAFETSMSDARGAFSFRTLPAGRVTITDDDGRARAEIVAPDEHVILKLKAGTRVTGLVVDDKGKPLTDFSINSRPVESSDGRFAVTARKGHQNFAVDAPGYAQLPFDVDVKEGANDVGTLRLSRGLTLTGVVRDAQTGAPVANALVDVAASESEGGFTLSERNGAVKTNTEGRYSLRVSPQASWVLVKHRDYIPVEKQRSAATANLDFALEQGGSMKVTVVDENDAPVKQAFVMAASGDRRASLESKDGHYEAKGLTAGSWTITVMAGKGALYRAHTETVGAAQVNVTLRPEKGTIEITTKGGVDALFINADIRTAEQYRAAGTTATNVPVASGRKTALFPGVWTAVMIRSDEISFQPLGELKTSVQVELKPQWQPMPAWE